MRLLIVYLCLFLIQAVVLYHYVRDNKQLRERGELLAALHVRDGTHLIEAPKDALFLSGSGFWFAPIPILTVNEWSNSGIVGTGKGMGSGQWSCPDGYVLKWDGKIPYCEKRN